MICRYLSQTSSSIVSFFFVPSRHAEKGQFRREKKESKWKTNFKDDWKKSKTQSLWICMYTLHLTYCYQGTGKWKYVLNTNMCVFCCAEYIYIYMKTLMHWAKGQTMLYWLLCSNFSPMLYRSMTAWWLLFAIILS